MSSGFTSKHVAEKTGISVAKIRHWVKLGHFGSLGIKRKRAFYFHNLEDAAKAALELQAGPEKIEAEPEPEKKDLLEQIDTMSYSELAQITKREELKTLVIRNRKHAEQYLLVGEHENVLRTLALEIRSHLEGMPSRLVTVVANPELDKAIYDFCVDELETLHSKIERLTK